MPEQEDIVGYIYILTNPSFPDYVKIGYANDVERRLDELNASECIPFAFRVYATYAVPSNLSDVKVHRIIDQLNPNLRSIERVRGHVRRREFYAMSPEDAYDLFQAMAAIHGCEARLKLYRMSEEEEAEQAVAQEIAEVQHERLSPFAFSKCNIAIGEEIEYCNDPGVKCKVIADKALGYQGQRYSLTALAQKLTGTTGSLAGPRYFKYKGEWLNTIRERVEGR